MSALAKYEGAVPMQAYFSHVAENLIKNLGEDEVLPAAEKALQKMHALGNQMGFEMWLGIQDALAAKLGPQAGAVVH